MPLCLAWSLLKRLGYLRVLENMSKCSSKGHIQYFKDLEQEKKSTSLTSGNILTLLEAAYLGNYCRAVLEMLEEPPPPQHTSVFVSCLGHLQVLSVPVTFVS